MVGDAAGAIGSLSLCGASAERGSMVGQALQHLPPTLARRLCAAGVRLVRCPQRPPLSSVPGLPNGAIPGELQRPSLHDVGCSLVATACEMCALGAARSSCSRQRPYRSLLPALASLAAGVTEHASASHWRALSAALVCMSDEEFGCCGALVRIVADIAAGAWQGGSTRGDLCSTPCLHTDGREPPEEAACDLAAMLALTVRPFHAQQHAPGQPQPRTTLCRVKLEPSVLHALSGTAFASRLRLAVPLMRRCTPV